MGRLSAATLSVCLGVAASFSASGVVQPLFSACDAGVVDQTLPLLLQPCFGRWLLLCSMTTAATAHLVVLANENGGFNVRPGQQQAGGTGKKIHHVFLRDFTNAHEAWRLLHGRVCSLACLLPSQGLAQDILSDLVEDACLGLCFEVHRAVKQGYFFLDDTDQESMRDFGKLNVIVALHRGRR